MKTAFVLICLMLFAATSARARPSVEKPLPLEVTVLDGAAVQISWARADPPRVGNVAVNRRRLGDSGPGTWRPVASTLGPVMRFVDDTAVSGVAYEYQVIRSARDIVDVGYVVAGTDVPAQDRRGLALLVVDESLAPDLADRLARFQMDLVGDGWNVIRRETPRGLATDWPGSLRQAHELRRWIQDRYFSDPFNRYALILVGHVPVVHSGRANPDGHEPKPHPTDLFYADMDGHWGKGIKGALRMNRVPGDFIEMQVGRIDMSNLARGDRSLEIRLLTEYFDKNHHWRHGLLGDLRKAYGDTPYLLTERYGLRAVVGPDNLAEGGHHGIGEQGPWLFGVSFGSWNGKKYPTFRNKAVFSLNFGSGKQHFNSPDNAITWLLAQPWYHVASGWGGRPAWWLHPMALGRSIGDVHKRTVNNGTARGYYRDAMDYYPTGEYLWRNPVWVNLMGDPTTRPFPVIPADDLTVRRQGNDMVLEWKASPDPDVIGYTVYRAAEGSTGFTALNPDGVIAGTRFTDTGARPGDWFMVRAKALKSVPAGSFHSYSQGVFARLGQPLVPGGSATVTASAGEPVLLSPGGRPGDGITTAFITAPGIGRMERGTGADWIFTPPADFAGTVGIRVLNSNGYDKAEGVLNVRIDP